MEDDEQTVNTTPLKRQHTENEKSMLRNKLEMMYQLQDKRKLLLEERKKLQGDTNPLKSQLHEELKEGPKRVQWEHCLVERVYKKQQRRPTLGMTYEAILKVLGPSGVEEVKAEVEKLKKEHAETQSVIPSVFIVPTGELRKTRKDKKETSSKPTTSRIKTKVASKKKFLRRGVTK